MKPCYPNYNLLLIASMIFFAACKTPVQEEQVIRQDSVKEQFIRTNQYMQRRHQDHISAFVERVGWEPETTSSGLWIVREKMGEGEFIDEGNRVIYSFESMLLDGSPCYRATEDNPKVVVIGKGGVESGVEEGLQKLREGAEAIFIIPPHLAHGNFGDRGRIPGNSVLIYKVRVLDVQ